LKSQRVYLDRKLNAALWGGASRKNVRRQRLVKVAPALWVQSKGKKKLVPRVWVMRRERLDHFFSTVVGTGREGKVGAGGQGKKKKRSYGCVG